jgi:hypothetical protein
MQEYELDHPEDVIVWIGDFNAHNPNWITSKTEIDKAGVLAQEFSEMFGYSQVVNFATREGNTLDLIYTKGKCDIYPIIKIGSSDHTTISAKFAAVDEVPAAPTRQPILRWDLAPWHHIKPAVKRALAQFDVRAFSTVDTAVSALDKILRYVKRTSPRATTTHPWWDSKCDKAYAVKQKAWAVKSAHPARYEATVKRCRFAQRRAFASYNRKLKARLAGMKCTDRQFWTLTKEIGGIAQKNAAAAPEAEALAQHFQSKMSNAKGVTEEEYVPADPLSVPLRSWRIRYKKVLRTLQRLDTSKSANGTPPKFLRECAEEPAPVLTKLFRLIVRQAKYPSTWKDGRVTALHKRASVLLAENYRPVTVLKNLSLVFETVIDDQFDRWTSRFIPQSQFGFVKGCGTTDYGSAMSFKIHDELNRRNEILIVSLDVKGTFDRVWWAKLKNRLAARGMTDRALWLIEDYLHQRHIQVVAGGKSSTKKEIFSGVPQGAKWSPKLWNFDISEMPTVVSDEAIPFNYADDSGLVYVITESNRDTIIDTVNADLQALLDWGADNHTTFEPSKTHMMVVSKKEKRAFDPTGIAMGTSEVEQVVEMKLVGFTFDEKLNWGAMVSALAKKARTRVDAIRRMARSLDSENMLTMYSAFVRPILEYGSTLFMGAKPTHLEKLDRVQRTMKRIGGFKAEPLAARREAALIALTLKQLDGDCREGLRNYAPVLHNVELSCSKENSRRAGLLRPDYSEKSQGRRAQDFDGKVTAAVKVDVSAASGLQVKNSSKHPKGLLPLEVFSDSAAGALPAIWAKLPQSWILQGKEKGWKKITKKCKLFLNGKEQKKRINAGVKKGKIITSNSTELNNELNWGDTDWNKEREEIKLLISKSKTIKCN